MAKQPKQAIPKWYITAAMLRHRGACRSQVRLFRDTFGNGRVEFNKKNWNRAEDAGLHMTWLASRVLPYSVYRRAYFAYPYTEPLFSALERQRLKTRITI